MKMFINFILLLVFVCGVLAQNAEEYKQLIDWLSQNGAKVDNLGLIPSGGRNYLISAVNRDYGSTLCEISIDLVLCKETILKVPFFQEYKDMDEKTLIIAFIHYASYYNKSTKFAPLINALNPNIRSPLIYSNENKELIRSIVPEFTEQLNKINAQVNDIYSKIISKHPEVYGNPSETVRFGGEIAFAAIATEVQSFSDIDGYNGTVFIPIIADTREVYSSFTPSYNKERKTFSSKIRFTSMNNVIGVTHLNDPMECDIESFLHYNQIPDVNIPCADITLLPEYREGERILELKRRKAYVALGISDSVENIFYRFRLSIHNPLPNKLLMYARLYNADDHNIDVVSSYPHQPVSIENEHKALKFLRKELMKIEDSFPTTLEYDQKKLSEIEVKNFTDFENRETLRFVVGFKNTIREGLNEIEKRWERLLYCDI